MDDETAGVPTDITTHQRQQLLDALMYYLEPETRRKIMLELPMAYNAYYGRAIVTVITP